jgi:uncharacterized protein
MAKLLMWVVVGFAAYAAYRFYVISKRRAAWSKPEKQANAVQTMVACAHCGVMVPSTEALPDSEGNVFCSAAHRHAGKKQSD